MTLAQPATAPAPVDVTGTRTVEPSRFDAYAAGSDPAAAGSTDRVLALAQRILVPRLSRMAQRRTRPSR